MNLVKWLLTEFLYSMYSLLLCLGLKPRGLEQTFLICDALAEAGCAMSSCRGIRPFQHSSTTVKVKKCSLIISMNKDDVIQHECPERLCASVAGTGHPSHAPPVQPASALTQTEMCSCSRKLENSFTELKMLCSVVLRQ